MSEQDLAELRERLVAMRADLVERLAGIAFSAAYRARPQYAAQTAREKAKSGRETTHKIKRAEEKILVPVKTLRH